MGTSWCVVKPHAQDPHYPEYTLRLPRLLLVMTALARSILPVAGTLNTLHVVRDLRARQL